MVGIRVAHELVEVSVERLVECRIQLRVGGRGVQRDQDAFHRVHRGDAAAIGHGDLFVGNLGQQVLNLLHTGIHAVVADHAAVIGFLAVLDPVPEVVLEALGLIEGHGAFVHGGVHSAVQHETAGALREKARVRRTDFGPVGKAQIVSSRLVEYRTHHVQILGHGLGAHVRDHRGRLLFALGPDLRVGGAHVLHRFGSRIECGLGPPLIHLLIGQALDAVRPVNAAGVEAHDVVVLAHRGGGEESCGQHHVHARAAGSSGIEEQRALRVAR